MTIINVCHYPSLTFFGLDNDSHGVLFSSLTLFPMTVISMCHFPSFSYFAHDNSLHGEPFSSIYLLRPWQLFAWWLVSHFPAYTYFAHDNGLHGEPFSSMNCIALDNGLHEEPFSIIELHRSWQWFGWHAIFHHFSTLSLICMEHHFPSLTYLLCSWQWFSWSTIFHHWLTLPLSQVWGFNKDEGVTFYRQIFCKVCKCVFYLQKVFLDICY